MTDIQSNLLNHLRQVVRLRDPFFAGEGHFFVREYIKQELANFGRVRIQDFLFNGTNYQNIILDLPTQAKIERQPPILIAAHYDTVFGSVGADDNGTGIAVLLELSRYFSTTQANYPLRFVAFDLEEYGLVGSRAYVEELKRDKQPLRLMLSLEMLGYYDSRPNSQRYPSILKSIYPSTGDFIALVGNLATIPEMIHFYRQIRTTETKCQWLPAGVKGDIVPDTRRSDHAPFWDAGYKAMMVTDTANLRNPHYHKSTDTIETLNLNFLTGVCRGLMLAIENL